MSRARIPNANGRIRPANGSRTEGCLRRPPVSVFGSWQQFSTQMKKSLVCGLQFIRGPPFGSSTKSSDTFMQQIAGVDSQTIQAIQLFVRAQFPICKGTLVRFSDIKPDLFLGSLTQGSSSQKSPRQLQGPADGLPGL